MKIEGMHEKELFESSFPFRLIINNNIDFTYPPHWHNAMELIYVEQNAFTVFVNSRKIVLKEKEILYIPGGDIHEFKDEPHEGTRYLVNFDFSGVGSFMQNIKNLLSDVRIIKPEESAYYQSVKSEIEKILAEYQSFGIVSQPYYIARILDILSLIRNHSPAQIRRDERAAGKKMLGLEKINKTFEYIEKNYNRNISLRDIASAVGFSEYYFSRIFKEITEKCFHQYLNEYRIKKAEGFLNNSNMTISQAAGESGFRSIATFERLFKQIKGCTPQEYRNLRV